MNINKLIIFIVTLVLLNFNNVWSEEKIKLDEEELPAIDPFQGNAAEVNKTIYHIRAIT